MAQKLNSVFVLQRGCKPIAVFRKHPLWFDLSYTLSANSINLHPEARDDLVQGYAYHDGEHWIEVIEVEVAK